MSRHTTTMLSDNPALAFTLIDFSHPAETAGQMTTATFRWTSGNCGNAAKIKVLRRSADQRLNTFTIIERGPFNVSNLTTVTLSPPIDVIPGDYIGVAQLRGQSRGPCGGTPLARSTYDQILLAADGDLQSGSFSSLRQVHGLEMSVMASVTPEVLARIIPVAGAAAGANNSFFRTAVQVTNTSGSTLSGRLVYHPAGQAAAANDPSIPFLLEGFRTLSHPDIVTLFGRTGVGSIDLITIGNVPPIVSARVYNDQGAAGTSGFTQEAFSPSEALHPGETAVLQAPPDITKFRLNIGVRTLTQPVTLNIKVQDGEGTELVQRVRTYPANYFIQTSAADFSGVPVPANSFITLEVLGGSAFVYGATTDNKTNDANIQFARRR
ncbi:MAG TPA: hypothetical protein VF846_18655 [Thermoanaerobaculia bacterium]|jgi:hypothetical protein